MMITVRRVRPTFTMVGGGAASDDHLPFPAGRLSCPSCDGCRGDPSPFLW